MEADWMNERRGAEPAGPFAPRQGWGFKPLWLLACLISVPLVASLFWWLGTRFFNSPLSFIEFHQYGVVLAAVIAGGYQLYFWVQRNNRHVVARCMRTPIDDRIPFWPSWVWLYSFFYFIVIGMTVVSIRDLAHGVHLIFGGVMLVAIGAAIFYVFPTEVPDSYRRFEITGLATRYLAFIQSMDNPRNAFPSMHCAIGAYVGLVVSSLPGLGIWFGIGQVVAIAISCVVVKQHVLVDTLAGIALGAAVYYVNFSLTLLSG